MLLKNVLEAAKQIAIVINRKEAEKSGTFISLAKNKEGTR